MNKHYVVIKEQADIDSEHEAIELLKQASKSSDLAMIKKFIAQALKLLKGG